jgi:ABC-type multidrug transport system fused ATPase/permease subunit
VESTTGQKTQAAVGSGTSVGMVSHEGLDYRSSRRLDKGEVARLADCQWAGGAMLITAGWPNGIIIVDLNRQFLYNRRLFMKWLNDAKVRFIYIGRMLRLLWEFDKAFLFLLIAGIIVDVINPFITMYLIKFSIDMLTAGSDYRSYLPTVLILLGVGFAGKAMEFHLLHPIELHGNMIGSKLFGALFRKTMTLNYEMLLDKNIMDKRQMAFKVFDHGRFTDLTRDFKSFIKNLMVVCGIIYIVARIDIWILFVVIAMVIINTFATAKRTRVNRDVWELMAPANRKIDYFLGVDADVSFGKEIRLYNMQDTLSRMYMDAQQTGVRYLVRLLGAFRVCNHIQNTTSLCLNVIIYGYLGFKVLVQRLITVGDFSLYLNAITTFNNSIQDMISSYIAISDNGQYLKDYFDFLELKNRYEKTGQKLPGNAGKVFVFENVSFSYPYQVVPALKNINLTIADGERLSLVGENGAGKTTLIKLLMRLYDPTEGRITLNSVDIKDIAYEEYLSLFASVFQDFKLFAFRIADNISSMQDGGELDREKLRDSLVKAGLNEKIESLEKGVETYLYRLYEPDGVELSGGESQKLAIARALYKDAPVVVLDEPTAALDPRAEYEIYLKFFDMVKDKTSVFITHRLSSTRFCDRIVVLKNGEVVETGSHGELLARKGYYAELFNMQAQFYTDTETTEAVGQGQEK